MTKKKRSKPRDTAKYDYRVRGRIVHSGITKRQLEERARELQTKYGPGRITQVGRRTTEEAARKWEKTKRKS